MWEEILKLPMSQLFSDKGQYALTEHMIFFTLGVIIFSSSFYTFTKVRDRIAEYSTKEVLKNIANYVVNNIVKAYVTGKNLNSSGEPVFEMKITLPRKVSGQYYRLNIRGGQARIFSLADPRINYTRSLYNLNESITINGTVDSRVSSTFVLKYNKTGDKIILR